MRSISRLITVLETVSSRTEGASIVDIAKVTGLHIATASRLIHALREEGMVELNSSGRCVVGQRIITIARRGMEQDELFIRAHPVMRRLRDLTGETVSLHVLFEDQRVCIGEVRSTNLVSRATPPGEVKPLVGTATGEALMVQFSDEQLADVLATHGRDPSELPALVARVGECRERGWCYVDTWVEGVGALSMPIRAGGRVIAALSISGPGGRFTRARAMAHLDAALVLIKQLSGESVKDTGAVRTEA